MRGSVICVKLLYTTASVRVLLFMLELSTVYSCLFLLFLFSGVAFFDD